MKNLITAVLVMMSIGAYSQNSWTDQEQYEAFEKVNVPGVDSVWIGGDWSITALNNSFTAFQEVVTEGVRVLEANGIEWDDQFGPEGSFDFTSIDQMKTAYDNVIYGGYSHICWRMFHDDDTSTLAFLMIGATGFQFIVEPHYIE